MKRCAICGQKADILLQLGEERRRLCKHHYQQHMAKDGDYDVIFQKASDL
uniref:Uncharacterized protein n=1 Tax=Yangshan Harbor Nitrososphaeria virus TaxID=2969597 RepID=A0A976UB61_9CAUD|nr:hypothetical protein [Yangshan Harbor Nitrososphaeria virus]